MILKMNLGLQLKKAVVAHFKGRIMERDSQATARGVCFQEGAKKSLKYIGNMLNC
jgi:hypothetical protein